MPPNISGSFLLFGVLISGVSEVGSVTDCSCTSDGVGAGSGGNP